jgi:hypothetical protein
MSHSTLPSWCSLVRFIIVVFGVHNNIDTVSNDVYINTSDRLFIVEESQNDVKHNREAW